MADSFVRVYGSMPGIEEILKIEGIVIVDLVPTGGTNVIGNNTVCVVGEFADMGRAVAVDATTGAVTTSCQPDLAYSAADFANKFGNFDSTIGKFGAEMGNGWVAVARKVWAQGALVCAPINLCSAYGTRYWRQLPTCRSATDVTPIVPLSAGIVPAAYEFRSGTSRVHLGTQVVFSSATYYNSGTDGVVVPAGLPAATQIFTSATGDFLGATDPTKAVTKGDAVVVGSLAGTGAVLTDAATLRVVSITNGTTLVLERLDGSNFTTGNWIAGTALPYRIHPALAADTGGNRTLSEAQGYTIPARPITATIAMATTLTPYPVPIAPTATLWVPLAGLQGSTHVSQPLTYTASVQAINAANSSALDALYDIALTSLLGNDFPQAQVYAVGCARKSTQIRASLRGHCLTSTANGHPRICYDSPSVNQASFSTIVGDADPGVGANRDERVMYRWYAVQTFIASLVGVPLVGSDGQTYTDGYVDTPFDEWCLAVRSLIAPELDPGQSTDPIPLSFANIIRPARGMPKLGIGEYITAKARGVGLVKIDRGTPQIQSSVTSSLLLNTKDENRRCFADFIIINITQLLTQFVKQPLTEKLKLTETAQVEAFLDALKGPVPSERIVDYSVDRFALNTPQLEEQGIFALQVSVEMVPIQKDIVIAAMVGPTVEVTQTQ